jgi:hypothetical protein
MMKTDHRFPPKISIGRHRFSSEKNRMLRSALARTTGGYELQDYQWRVPSDPRQELVSF